MALASSTGIGHVGFVALSDLSGVIFDALDQALPNDDCHLVWHVDVFEGWGGAHFVTVCSGVSRSEAGAALAEKILAVVAGVMDGRRHDVRIIWRLPGLSPTRARGA
jgi:hypothetical protein